jgi:hypothetical protein
MRHAITADYGVMRIMHGVMRNGVRRHADYGAWRYAITHRRRDYGVRRHAIDGDYGAASRHDTCVRRSMRITIYGVMRLRRAGAGVIGDYGVGAITYGAWCMAHG